MSMRSSVIDAHYICAHARLRALVRVRVYAYILMLFVCVPVADRGMESAVCMCSCERIILFHVS